MSGNICQYFNCYKSKRNFPKLKMFRFPRDEKRLKTWVVNTGNLKLLPLDETKLYNRYLCQEHFSPDCFKNTEMTKLKPTAIPHKFDDSDQPSTSSGINENEESPLPSNSDDHNLLTRINCSFSQNAPVTKELSHRVPLKNTPFKRQVQETIKMPSSDLKNKIITMVTLRKRKLETQCNRKFKNKLSRMSESKKNINKSKRDDNINNLIDSFDFPSTNSRALVTMQLRKNSRSWSPEEKRLSLTLFYRCPDVYDFLKTQRVNLPSTSTICRWIGGSCEFWPGFGDTFLRHVRRKFAFKTERQRKCTVCFDEITVDERLTFSRRHGLVEGFEDLGKFGRTDAVANTALAFVVRGVHATWEMPIAYYLHARSATKRDSTPPLKDLIAHVIRTLSQTGLRPVAIVCDQDAGNQHALKSLYVTDGRPYFFVGGQKVYALFDAGHLLKSVRNNLIDCSFVKTGGKTVARYSDIRDAYDADRKNTADGDDGRTMPRITDAHVYPNAYQKTRVELAEQLFDRAVSAAVRARGDGGGDTADFVDFIRSLYECLTGGVALQSADAPQLRFLRDASAYFGDLYKLSKNQKTTCPSCFHGIAQTVNGVLMLCEDERRDGERFLLPGRLNAARAVERLLFAAARRAAGGHNRHPTARLVRKSFRRAAVCSLMCRRGTETAAGRGGQCCRDDDDGTHRRRAATEDRRSCDDGTCAVDTCVALSSGSESDPSTCSEADDEDGKTESGDDDDVDCSSNTVAAAMRLARVCSKMFNCDRCKTQQLATMAGDKPSRIVNSEQNCCSDVVDDGSGAVPSRFFVDLVDCAIDIVEDKFFAVRHEKDIKSTCMAWFKKCDPINNWLGENDECAEHKRYILNELLTREISRKCKKYSSVQSGKARSQQI